MAKFKLSRDQIVHDMALDLNRRSKKHIEDLRNKTIDLEEYQKRITKDYEFFKSSGRHSGYVGIKFDELWKDVQTEALYLNR